MLRCTVAGMMPLMKSKEYKSISEQLYTSRLGDFEKIREKKSYYAIPNLPKNIAKEILEPIIPDILSKQKQNGFWGKNDNTKQTYEILSALKYVGKLDSLYKGKQLNNSKQSLEEKYDYYAILIKKEIYQCLTAQDDSVIQEMIEKIASNQEADGSWEHSVVATVYFLDRLTRLGVSKEEQIVKKGIQFLLDSMVEEADACQKNGPYGLKIENVFTKDRMLEFEKAEKYYEEYIPRSKCFTHIALMQNSLCLNLLITLGYEDNEKVRKSMNSIYGLYCEYGGFCISDIKKKYLDAEKKKRSKSEKL